jgi:hypothetical protein
MNSNLLGIVQRIIAGNGEAVLDDAKRLKAFFSDLAKDEPKPLRIAFGHCIESGAYNALKTAPDAAERATRKTAIVQRLRDEHGLDAALCGEALDVLEAALFEEAKPPPLCTRCGKALQEDWTMCPYCGTVCGAAEQPAPLQPPPERAPDYQVPPAYTAPPPPPPARKSIFNKNLLDMVKNTVFSIKKRLKRPLFLPENVKIDFRAPPVYADPAAAYRQPNPPLGKQQSSGRKVRHGFTMFWLILEFTISVGFFMFLLYEMVDGYYGTLVMEIILILLGLLAVCLFLLLHWKKVGFQIMVIAGIAGIVALALSEAILGVTVGYIAGILIILTYGVLRLRGSNGKSAWEQLE